MNYKPIIIAIALCGIGLSKAHGQQLPPFQFDWSSGSNVRYATTNYGIFGLDIPSASGGFFVPGGSGKSYLYGSGIWFGAQKQVSQDGGITYQDQKLSFICYNPNSGKSWATPGEYDWSQGASPILYHSADYNRTDGKPVDVNSSDPNWPLWLRLGEQTQPSYPGVFVPQNSARQSGMVYDRPAFMQGVDEEFFARYHDRDLSQYEIGTTQAQSLGYPLGLQIQQHVYSWAPGRMNQNVVVLQYEVTNASNDVLHDCRIAQVVDLDIGAAENDHLMFYNTRPELHTGIAWTEPEQENYGLLAMIMLESPVTDAEGFIDNSRRALFSSEGKVGTLRDWSIAGDPATPEERYDFMAASQLDGDNGPADKRALIGSGAFNMKPGDKAYFTFAFAVLDGVTVNGTSETKGGSLQGANIPELEALAEDLHDQYYETGFAPMVSGVTAGKYESGISLGGAIVPNPSRESAMLQLTLPEQSDLQIRVIDNLGRTVATEQVNGANAGMFAHRLNLQDLQPGSYLISVEAGGRQQSLRLNLIR